MGWSSGPERSELTSERGGEAGAAPAQQSSAGGVGRWAEQSELNGGDAGGRVTSGSTVYEIPLLQPHRWGAYSIGWRVAA